MQPKERHKSSEQGFWHRDVLVYSSLFTPGKETRINMHDSTETHTHICCQAMTGCLWRGNTRIPSGIYCIYLNIECKTNAALSSNESNNYFLYFMKVWWNVSWTNQRSLALTCALHLHSRVYPNTHYSDAIGDMWYLRGRHGHYRLCAAVHLLQ